MSKQLFIFGLFLLFMSCGHLTPSDKTEKSVNCDVKSCEEVEDRPLAKEGSSDRQLIYNKDGRVLYLERDTSGFTNCYSVVNGKTKRMRYGNEVFDDVFFRLTYYAYERYIYIVGDTNPNGSGWISRFFLYRIDTNDFSLKEFTNGPAVRFGPQEIIIPAPRLTNPDVTCTVDEVWAMHDVHYDISGNKVGEDKEEYDYKEMERRYGDTLVNSREIDAE